MSVLYGKTYFIETKYGDREEYIRSYSGLGLSNGNARFLNSIRQYALKLVAPSTGMKVLDVGCGTGQFAYQLAQAGCKVYGIDMSVEALQSFNEVTRELDESIVKRVCLMFMDAQDIGNLDGPIEVITMMDFIEHLTDVQLEKVFLGAKRLLPSGGRIVIHTLPTRKYHIIGSVITSLLTRGKITYNTLEDEEKHAGHINIQSRASLSQMLKRQFPNGRIRVWYHMSNTLNFRSKLGNASGLRAFLSPSLWATVQLP